MNKENILTCIKEKISEKIHNLEYLISETRASNNDTKSSMGDKYETGREMIQQEINNLQRQLNEVLVQQGAIQKLNAEPSAQVQNGALVKTDKGLFYVSVSIGEIVIDNQKMTTVSTESPLVKAMFGKKLGETFEVNKMSQIIESIW